MTQLTLKDPQQELQFFLRRTLIILFGISIFVLAIIGRLFYLQIYQHELYTTLSNNNQLSLVPIEPNRGLIFDRNGVLLAENVATFSLELMPSRIKNLKQTIKQLGKLIAITEFDITSFNKQRKQTSRFEYVPLRFNLSETEVAIFSVNQYLFPGVEIKARLMRHYPFGTSFSHVLGYVGRINEQELNQIDETNYRATHFIGKVGIEKFYENELHGTVGHEQAEIDASGRMVRVLKRTPPIPGYNLYLTIDSELQVLAEKAFNDFQVQGALVALIPQTGEVLAMVSVPGFDPHVFIRGISTKDYQTLSTAKERPLYNRATRGQYPLASTAKPFLALQGYDNGYVNLSFAIHDPGYYVLPRSGHVYKDWRKGGHGVVNLPRAIMVSCDTYFYTLAYKMGISNIHNILTRFGFGSLTDIDIPDELPGLVPSEEWKLKTKGERWYLGDTISAGIGQGYLLTTPLQLASAVSTMSLRGERIVPHLLLKKQSANEKISVPYAIRKKPPVELHNPKNWDPIIDAMQEVIHNPGGTGFARYGKVTYSIAGKTGTAQVYSSKRHGNLNEKHLPANLRHLQDHSLFIAFAPAEQPQIALAVIAENTHDAAKIAKIVIEKYLKIPQPTTTPVQKTVAISNTQDDR